MDEALWNASTVLRSGLCYSLSQTGRGQRKFGPARTVFVWYEFRSSSSSASEPDQAGVEFTMYYSFGPEFGARVQRQEWMVRSRDIHLAQRVQCGYADLPDDIGSAETCLFLSDGSRRIPLAFIADTEESFVPIYVLTTIAAKRAEAQGASITQCERK